MFTVDQKVHCKRNGDGVVTATSDACKDYPIEVRFADGHYESYTLGGKLFENSPETHLTSRKEEVMTKDFYVGQKVWCVIFGEGVVAEITCDRYPVKVKFENGEVESYTSGGYMFSIGNRALFRHPVKIVQDESATKPSIDWEHVSSEFKYLAEDADGGVFLYEDKPFTATETWTVDNGELAEAHMLASYTEGACDWKESLIERPKN